MRILQRIGSMVALGLACGGCTALPMQDNAPTLTQFPAQTAETTPDIRLTVAAPAVQDPAAETPITLSVWLPEPLAPVDNEEAAEMLSQQISGFLSSNPDILIDLRLKRPSDVGGILATLRSASAVAPDAMPDITLLRRADLIAAVDGGYLETFDDHLPIGFFDDFNTQVIGLGRVEERQYGVPYMLDVLHTAYNRADTPPDVWTLDAMLDGEVPFVFPASRPGILNETLLAQLMAAGAVFDSDGGLTLDQNSLNALYLFYQRGVENGIVSPNVLTYTDPTAYAGDLVTQHAVGVINARLYRQLIAQGESLAPGLIPTLEGNPSTVMDGWMWVLVTADGRQQQAAFRFLTWVLDAQRQQRYTDAIGLIPSQESALRLWDDTDYAALVEQLLANAVYPADANNAAVNRLLQNALVAVINQDQTANDAVQSLLAQLGG